MSTVEATPLWDEGDAYKEEKRFQDVSVPRWAGLLYQQYWGKPVDFPIAEHSDGETYHQIQDPALRLMGHHSIIIRKDYQTAWNLLEKHYELGIFNGTCIIGQPGSGKSFSLIYLIIRCLMAKRAVAWVTCLHSEPILLFFENGIKVVTPLFWRTRRRDHGPIVVLHDAYIDKVPIKGELYASKAPNYVVLATSPIMVPYRQWEKERLPFYLVVKPVSRAKLVPDEFSKNPLHYDALTIFDHLGPNLKLIQQLHLPMGHNNDAHADFYAYFNETAEIASGPLSDWIMKTDSTFATKEAEAPRFHTVFCIHPVDSTAEEVHSTPQVEIRLASKFISDIFLSELHHRSIQEVLEFAYKFIAAPSVASYVFETHAMRYLSWSKARTTIVMADGINDEFIPVVFATADALLDIKMDLKPRPDTLHIAKTGTPTIDGLYHGKAEGTLYLLQTTTASTHTIKESGLTQVVTAFGKDPCLDDVVLIFVVPDADRGEKLNKSWPSGLRLRIPGFGHFHCRVGYTVVDE